MTSIAHFQALSEEEIIAIATPIMDNLMDASTRIDHKAHVRDFSDRLKEIVTEAHLQQVCESYQSELGFFTKRELVAVFTRPDSAVIIWKQFFTKAEGEFVAELMLIRENDKYLVEHVVFF